MKKVAFTIMFNGMRFLPEQIKRIPKMFDKWYIIEGPVNPVHCTSWCKEIPAQYVNDMNMSSDGTYEYLNNIDNDKIEVIRSPIVDGRHRYWDGKLEMCNSFMDKIENALLMQIDMDEFWGDNTLNKIFDWSKDIGKCMAQFKCNFYVGENLITTGTNCYGDMPYEWNRLWTIKNKTTWKSHEPPKLNRTGIHQVVKDVTSRNNWGFRHYAYAYEEQLKFKEDYYGYTGAVEGWKRLQSETKFPVYLRNYFPWVTDNTQVVKI